MSSAVIEKIKEIDEEIKNRFYEADLQDPEERAELSIWIYNSFIKKNRIINIGVERLKTNIERE